MKRIVSKQKQEKLKKTYYEFSDIFRLHKEISILRKMLYVSTVFFGFSLVWYGVFSFISATWPLNIPIVAIVLGVILLYINGRTNTLA